MKITPLLLLLHLSLLGLIATKNLKFEKAPEVNEFDRPKYFDTVGFDSAQYKILEKFVLSCEKGDGYEDNESFYVDDSRQSKFYFFVGYKYKNGEPEISATYYRLGDTAKDRPWSHYRYDITADSIQMVCIGDTTLNDSMRSMLEEVMCKAKKFSVKKDSSDTQ